MNKPTMEILIQSGKLFGLAAGMAILVTGCQTYKPPMESWRQGNAPESAKQFTAKAEKKKTGNKDVIIWRLEQGATLRAAGQYRESNAAFDAAEEKINEYDDKAKVSVSQETKALLSNQANLPYEGRDYDKIMLNAYKALNYLQLGEPDKARVELVRASQRQQDAEENNKRRIEKTEEATEKLKDAKDANGKPVKGVDQGKEMADKAKADPKFNQKIAADYGYLDSFLAKTNYVNPFVYYLDALFFLTANADRSDLERARDSLRFTLGSIGENKYIMQDLKMVDQALQGTPIPPTTYVIFETGCAPERGQIRIDIPLFIVGVRDIPYVGAAFPTLKPQDNYLHSLSVTINNPIEMTNDIVTTVTNTVTATNDIVTTVTNTVTATNDIVTTVTNTVTATNDIVTTVTNTVTATNDIVTTVTNTVTTTNDTTVLLASMDSIVARSFKDELPMVITKTLISTTVKAAAAYGVNKAMEKQDAWAQLCMKVFLSALQASVNIADTRTWNTLPKEFQFCRIPTPPDRKIKLSGPNGESKVEVTVGDGTVNLIYVKSNSATNALMVTQIKLK